MQLESFGGKTLGRLTAVITMLCVLLFTPLGLGRTIDFNRGWKFKKGDSPGAHEIVHEDADWQKVRTPHDWAISGPFDPEMNGYAGKLPWKGVGWYRKWVMLKPCESGSKVYLDFDGVMAFPRVYVNGQLAGSWDYGYTPFRVDITPFIKFGRANVVAVRADTRAHRTRWYPGAGIYRKVHLTVSPPTHLSHEGTTITTPKIADDLASVVVTNEVENHLKREVPIEVEVALKSPDGSYIASQIQRVVVAASGVASVSHEFKISQPVRWDIDTPKLHETVTSLRVGDQVVERRENTFGIRTFHFSADDGFHLNGRRVQLKGVNLHHDHGPLGAAFNARAMERQLELMQDMGVNAIRTSHNPPSAEMLDLCDRRGLLVWDELFDKWDGTAGRINHLPRFESHIERHSRSVVRRDRNHPSIIVWSVGNEILNHPDDLEGKTRERVAYAREQILRHDNTRPVGLGCFLPHTADTDILADLDLTGWNYQDRYSRFREQSPEVPIVYSESASTLCTRGHYTLPLPTTKSDFPSDPQINAYELTSAAWADIPEAEFKRMQRDSFVAGEFVWTGFDYLGEPTPYAEQARSSYFGIMDLVGIPKDRFYLYRSHWRPEVPTVHIAPHWNWSGHQGKVVPVFVYTNGDSAELFVNGQSAGVRHKGERPERPVNLITEPLVTTSSYQAKTPSTNLVRSESDARNRSQDSSDEIDPLEITADLGTSQHVGMIVLTFKKEAKLYDYSIEVSLDGNDWSEVARHLPTQKPLWGGEEERFYKTDVEARYLRVLLKNSGALQPERTQLAAYHTPIESEYYAPTYDFRLRWNNVIYEPGKLKAVAYLNGQVIGEQIMRTAGAPASLRLIPDRSELSASGEDLCYLLVEAIDEQGVLCPRAMNQVRIDMSGPCKIAGVGNGNPLSLAPFQSNEVALFYGKAMIIVRPKEGAGGPITLSVHAKGLRQASASLKAIQP